MSNKEKISNDVSLKGVNAFPILDEIIEKMPGQNTYTIPLKALLLTVSSKFANMNDKEKTTFLSDIVDNSSVLNNSRSDVIITDTKDLETLEAFAKVAKKYGKKVFKKAACVAYGKDNIKTFTFTLEGQ